MKSHTNLDIAQSNSVYRWLAGVQPQDDPNRVESHGSRPRAECQEPQDHSDVPRASFSSGSQRRRRTQRDDERLHLVQQSTPSRVPAGSPLDLPPLGDRQGIENGHGERFDNNTADPYSTKTYGRKPRRKTRPDRYELKDSIRSKSRRTVDEEGKGQDKTRKRRKTSALAKPEDNFKAPNVLQERLTVCSTRNFLHFC